MQSLMRDPDLTEEEREVIRNIQKKENTESEEAVHSPSHYNNYDVEVIDMMIKIWGAEAVKIFCKLNAFKYRMRVGLKKHSLEAIQEDLNKESWYLHKLKELDNSNLPF